MNREEVGQLQANLLPKRFARPFPICPFWVALNAPCSAALRKWFIFGLFLKTFKKIHIFPVFAWPGGVRRRRNVRPREPTGTSKADCVEAETRWTGRCGSEFARRFLLEAIGEHVALRETIHATRKWGGKNTLFGWELFLNLENVLKIKNYLFNK